MKKCWCQLNSKGVPGDWYIFWIFLRKGITVSGLIPNFRKRVFWTYRWAPPKRPIQNWVNEKLLSECGYQIPNWNLFLFYLTKGIIWQDIIICYIIYFSKEILRLLLSLVLFSSHSYEQCVYKRWLLLLRLRLTVSCGKNKTLFMVSTKLVWYQ